MSHNNYSDGPGNNHSLQKDVLSAPLLTKGREVSRGNASSGSACWPVCGGRCDDVTRARLSLKPLQSNSVNVCGHAVEAWNDDCFTRLRARHGVPDDFIQNTIDLHRHKNSCRMPNEGKGGTALYLSDNMEYIVKEISDSDHAMLLLYADSYIAHMLEDGGDISLLVPIYLHFVLVEEGNEHDFHSQLPGHQRTIFIAMRNLFPSEGPFVAKYDLKGCDDDKTLEYDGRRIPAVHKRFWRIDMWCKCCCGWTPQRWAYYLGKVHARALHLELPPSHRDEIVGRIKSDTKWLMDHGLMDYSLMVGIQRFSRDVWEQTQGSCAFSSTSSNSNVSGRGTRRWCIYHENQVRVVTLGIIDFLQPWTAGKRVAMGIKMLEPNKSTVPPLRYGTRFRDHFVQRLRANSRLPSSPVSTGNR